MKSIKFLLFTVAAAILFAGCVKDEIFEGPPSISQITLNPQSPGQGEDITVSAKVVDLNGVETVELYYKIGDGSFTSVTMTADGDIYSGVIPAQDAGTQILYYIKATNVIGKTSLSPSDAPNTTASITVGAALIVMNEIQARGTVDAPDWIEIYNGSADPVDVSGYKVYDSGGQSGSKAKRALPAGTIIPAMGFIVVVTDDTDEQYPLGSGFGMSSAGEQIWLENADGYIIDTFTFGVTADATQSYGRKPDGSNTFVVFTEITKGTTNNNAAVVVAK